ncbi:hypothetical protein ES319_A01G097200v1 [Gossypium barbadense]|uniref:RING-type domain-containing protein n=1 Tax=Gossypium barbadense TaxID=3634 RepID=A0A5J5WWM0_GOSBA|nr:hypothetical protein ES319_A01G097200v1 [Gossypium barbadense]
MGTLQSRLDAEFLLAHMCSVKFKEWIVVLATLLRRSEVLFDLFRHDMRLWKAYNMTLQLGCRSYSCKQDVGGDEEEEVECAICLCKIDEDDEIPELRCDHLFHKVCLDRWAGYRRSTCPICRTSLTPRQLISGMEVIHFKYCSLDDTSHRETWWLR